jgi:hypothetical protein
MNYDNTHRTYRGGIVRDNKDFLQDKFLFEFGVCHGTSLLMWYQLYQEHNVNGLFVGFDSFQGLPEEHEDRNSIWKPKQFSTNGAVNPDLCNKDDMAIVTGFYTDSLTEELTKSFTGAEIGLVHIDCDTYSSTKTVWEWLLKYDLLANGAIIVYDDWGAHLEANCDEYDIGEAKAHKEIQQAYGVNFTDLGDYVVDPRFYKVKIFRYE